MEKEELETLIDRFSEGKTTKEEDFILLKALNASAELLEAFLNEIKVAKIKQSIQGK